MKSTQRSPFTAQETGCPIPAVVPRLVAGRSIALFFHLHIRYRLALSFPVHYVYAVHTLNNHPYSLKDA